VKVKSVKANNRKRAFEIDTARRHFSFPYAKAGLVPTAADPIVELYVDPEIAREGFVYRLRSGAEETVLLDQVLEYVHDPSYMRNLLLYKLTVEARNGLAGSGLSKREVIRRLGTSPAQFYRLLDTANYRKTVDQLLRLLQVLDREVEFVVRPRAGAE
jgi:hypothetical protein